MKRRLISIILVVLVVAVTGACGDSTSTEEGKEVSASDGLHYVTEFIKARSHGGSSLAPWYRTLDETLPNVQYLQPDGQTRTVTDLAVVGRIVTVEKGRGFTVPGCKKFGDGECDTAEGVPSDFDDHRAQWWSVHATIAVEHAIGSTADVDEVRVALPLSKPADFDLMATGLKALGRVVAFLEKDSPLVAYDPSLYIIIREFGLVATVAADGALALPLVPSEASAALLAPTPRLSDLEAKGALPRTLLLKPGDGPWYHERADAT